MKKYRKLTESEIQELRHAAVSAENWSLIDVSQDFETSQLQQCRLEGIVRIDSQATIIRSRVRNYHIGQGSLITGVTALECRHRSSFGNGVEVATINENGGRTIRIHDRLSSGEAYMAAVYRHRPKLIERLDKIAQNIADQRLNTMGQVGTHCRLMGARFIREVSIGDRVEIDGASMLENGTILNDAQIGVDVKAYDFIVAEAAQIDNGTILERCFVGESCILDKSFTAADSVFFANSHCENGEAASIFAGPYTVTHHKSSLLIAGLFSFFNAGSGSNQSNHLFKSGAVHQAIHLRGCKFASSAYIMSPALEGAFTMVMGHHSFHHNTSIFPYSYLVERDQKSFLMPGANLTSYGSVRDVEKWQKRDRRKVFRDVISFEEYNPYIIQSMMEGLDQLHALEDADPDAATYVYDKVQIRQSSLRRGITLYNKTIAAALGAMIERGEDTPNYDGSGRWTDLGGQYITRNKVEELIEKIEADQITTADQIHNVLRVFHAHYSEYARSWAEDVLASMLGHRPSQKELQEVVESGRNIHSQMRQMTDQDRQRDSSVEMSVGYGFDTATQEERLADYCSVRGLNLSDL